MEILDSIVKVFTGLAFFCFLFIFHLRNGFLKVFFPHHFNLPLNIVLCKIVMYRGYVDSVVIFGFCGQLFNDWLSLRHVTGSSNLANEKHM